MGRCWEETAYPHRVLQTCSGQELQILSPGELNPHAGPDYFNARIRIDGLCWAGNVEIHVRASQWRQHGHHRDPAYNNVILHVVAIDDVPVFTSKGIRVPALVLTPSSSKTPMGKNTLAFPPCQRNFSEFDRNSLPDILDGLYMERSEAQQARIRQVRAVNQYQWEQSLVQLLGAAYGLQINALPFERLIRGIPYKILYEHRNDRQLLEAILFGRAGFLGRGRESGSYWESLWQMYKSHEKEIPGSPLLATAWKFLRIRPGSFPTLRISQFAGLLHFAFPLLKYILEARNQAELRALFRHASGTYWENHYQFGKLSPPMEKHAGEQFISTLLINTISPFLLCYGQAENKPELSLLAHELLEEMEAESNHITRSWAKAGLKASNAKESQALLHLYKNYCKQKRCLDCLLYRKLKHPRLP